MTTEAERRATWVKLGSQYHLTTRVIDGAVTIGSIKFTAGRTWYWKAAGQEGTADGKCAAQRRVRKALREATGGKVTG